MTKAFVTPIAIINNASNWQKRVRMPFVEMTNAEILAPTTSNAIPPPDALFLTLVVVEKMQQ